MSDVPARLDVPAHLKDAKDLLTENGFTTGDTWYHGTSSALIESIKENGLKRSGDKAMKQAAKRTMATIGNNYTESIEPVFLTQSKELAYYWAEQTVRNRRVRIEGEESPAVLSIKLPDEQNQKVRPDVGAASLLLIKEGEHFLAHLAGIYEACGFEAPNIDLMKAERTEYLTKLGMAYISQDIDKEYLDVI